MRLHASNALQYAALTRSRICRSLSLIERLRVALVRPFVSCPPGVNNLGRKNTRKEESEMDRSNERTNGQSSIKTRLLFALRQRNAAAAATMCPMISGNFEFELYRRAAHKSRALYFDCVHTNCNNSELAEEPVGGENRSAEVRGGKQCEDSFHRRRELRDGIKLDAPHSREENRRCEMWPSLPRSLTLLSFHSIALSRLRC